jgi:hypothetical protein
VIRLSHVITVRHGHLPRRLESCGRYGCLVDEQGVTSCGELACPNCGVGPVVVIRYTHSALCEICSHRWPL